MLQYAVFIKRRVLYLSCMRYNKWGIDITAAPKNPQLAESEEK